MLASDDMTRMLLPPHSPKETCVNSWGLLGGRTVGKMSGGEGPKLRHVVEGGLENGEQ